MRPLRVILSLATLIGACCLGSCGGSGGSSQPYPAGLAAKAAESAVIVSWDEAPGNEYWVFYAPAPTIDPSTYTTVPGAVARVKVSSPYTVSGLTNGVSYAFTVNARFDGGPGGPGAPSVTCTPRLAGGTWSANVALPATSLYGVTFAGQTYMAVGSNGALYTSLDSETWTPQVSTLTTDLKAVAYSAGWVAVGNGGGIVTSADNVTWTARGVTPTAVTADLYGLASSGNGTLVAVGAGGTILYSSNAGVNWTAAVSGTTQNLYGVSYAANGQWTVVGAAGTILVATTSLATWVPVASNTLSDLYAVAAGSVTTGASQAVVFAAVGAGGTVVSSGSGVTWTPQTAVGTQDLTAVHFGGQFVAVGKAGALYTSTDGINWTARSSSVTQDLHGVTYGVSTITNSIGVAATGSLGYSVVGGAGTNLSAF